MPGVPGIRGLTSAIMSATAELLVEIGYSSLSVAAVAERAGTTKSALYRRWSSKAELVHEAAFPVAPTALQAPAGDIAADVRMMIEATRDVFTTPVVRAALPGLVADMTADADLNARVMSRFTDLFTAVRMRLREAVRRGEAHPGVDPDRLIELIGGATMLRMLLRPDEKLDDVWVDQTTAIVLHGVTRMTHETCGSGRDRHRREPRPGPGDRTGARRRRRGGSRCGAHRSRLGRSIARDHR